MSGQEPAEFSKSKKKKEILEAERFIEEAVKNLLRTTEKPVENS